MNENINTDSIDENQDFFIGPKNKNLNISIIPKSFLEKIKTKATINKVLTFTTFLTFTILILAYALIGLIVINVQSVEDVISLWINDLTEFIILIFNLIIFIEVILFAIFLIKLLTIQKEFKKKRFIFWGCPKNPNICLDFF